MSKTVKDVAMIIASIRHNRKNCGRQTLSNIVTVLNHDDDKSVTTKEIGKSRTRITLDNSSSDRMVHTHKLGFYCSCLDSYD